MSLHLMASVPAVREMNDRKELTQPYPVHLFDSTRVFNQNPTEMSKQSWVIAKSHPYLKKK